MLDIFFNVIDEVTLPILKELRGLRSRSIKLWFDQDSTDDDQKYILSIKDKKMVQHSAIDNELQYYGWNVEDTSVISIHNGLKHLISRCILENAKFVCIDNKKHCNDQLVLFRDAVHKSDLPDRFVKIPCFCSKDILFEYCDKEKVFTFSLDDTKQFKKCNCIEPVQGASVYREISTGRYWYRDMLHKTHYEVFDGTGKIHLGEADLDGELNVNKKDASKRPIIR